MDRLSSCYFCGTALDASLSEYPVVPRALQPAQSDDRTVVLCPTCRRKLATIVESVLAAAGDDAPDGKVANDAATLPSAADDEDLTGMLDESGMEPGPDPMALSDASESEVDESPSETTDEAADRRAGAPTDSDERTHGTTESVSANGEQASDRSRDSDTATDPDQAGDEQPGDDRSGDGQSGEEENGTDGQGLTRLEYNKVMRLLQNRELPVDRSEIRTVAVNAYEIDPAEFDTIVDAAIDRDLIAEREGQLVSPE